MADPCDIGRLRSLVARADATPGVPAEDVQMARERLAVEEERAEVLQELGHLVRAADERDMGSFADVRMAAVGLADALLHARAKGCPEAALRDADLVRKRLHNVAEDLRGAIRVVCRIRPLSQKERDAADPEVVRALDATTLEVLTSSVTRPSERYSFDAVFFPGTQEEIFEDCRRLVRSALDGYNVSLFAYGQTGAGKTHTMYGQPGGLEGTAPRTVEELYRLIGQDESRFDHRVTASLLELYKNELVDLLADRSVSVPGRRLSVRVDKNTQVSIDGLSEQVCASAADLLRLLERGAQARRVACTAMNSQSSRSHLVLWVRVARTDKASGECALGKIAMCDLAGSERLKKSFAVGEAEKEAIEINKSLTAVGDVIEALTTRQRHVPYKNHKLTQVLQDALGGTSKTLIFVNCSPAASNFEETVNALKYATRVKHISPKSAGGPPRRP
uniref:Kinesin-like protein n=1 Tax=Zooxanthella nutricula TaxID=1333877 RepID=A0A6U6V4M0_9DINO